MNRRSFLRTAALGAGATAARASLPKAQITRIRYYKTPTDAAGRPNTRQPLFNQSSNVVVVETDAGLAGIGEGGAHDTMEQCAGMLIGEDPFQSERLWQTMTRSYFYPAGRERLHAIGALDMALWDLKGKALGAPLHELLGGRTREYVECYSTGFPRQGDEKETARACVEFGFRAYRTQLGGGKVFDRFEEVRRSFEQCQKIREAVGKDGAWAIDYHTRVDMTDAVALSNLIEPLRPYFVEDLVRSENPGVYRTLRGQVKVPIAVGEQYGNRWDMHELIEQHLIDYARVTVPNTGGITEFLKITALCETHAVGVIPHFTGPISEAAMVHLCTVFPGQALMEMLGKGDRKWAYLTQGYDFRNGKLWPN
ncbi:MAG: mandelate racemase/muconate lactonizing enzyme family protein, partial [Acidobacteria bacterium]|nr:mandelate racemase/muconate lactonizing enzyme family protein [Acidobacteriota bacterium]